MTQAYVIRNEKNHGYYFVGTPTLNGEYYLNHDTGELIEADYCYPDRVPVDESVAEYTVRATNKAKWEGELQAMYDKINRMALEYELI